MYVAKEVIDKKNDASYKSIQNDDSKKMITQIGFGPKTLILPNGQAVKIDDDNYQQLKQNNQIVKENGLEYIINPSIMVDETGKEHVISTPIPEKTPDLPGYPVNDNNKPTIETYPEAEKQEKLPGFTPAEPLEGLKGSTIPEQNFDDYVFQDVKVKNGKVDLNDFDLTNEEEKGHTIERHVGKTQKYLEDRGIRKATTYTDLKTANEVTKEILKDNEAEIVKWLEGANVKDNEAFAIRDLGKVTGQGLKEGEKELSQKKGGKVVIVKTGNNEFSIKTSFPIN